MPRKSRQKLIHARRREQVANLYLQGWAQAAIADHLQVAQPTVSRDLKRIYADWRQSSIRDFDLLQSIELQKLDRLERESWAAWERSQKPAHQARIKGGLPEKNAERLIRNQVGDPRFLEQVHKCLAARRTLLGLGAPARIEPVPEVGVPMTLEQRKMHILAIIQEVEEHKLTQEASDEERTIEATSRESA